MSIYDVTFNKVRFIDTISWDLDDFSEVASDLIKKECKGRSILMLNDMTDQHFKGGQRLPVVGVMDRASVLQRKLKVAFPNYSIRGSLSMGGRKASEAVYLFAAVPDSLAVSQTIDAATKSLSAISGFCLLPVEASDMVRTLGAKLAGKERKMSRWIIFMGQHSSGSLRQVIVRDGQLVMTRMTPVVDIAEDPEGWANEVHQEFKATISYLSRVGYTSEDDTDVVVVAESAPGESLKKLISEPCHYTSLTVSEAARTLGVNIGLQENQGYADALHAAWIGRKTSFILPMKAGEIDKVKQPRQVVAMLVLLLALGGCYLTWVFSGYAQNIFESDKKIKENVRLQASAQSEYDVEAQRVEALGVDVKLLQAGLGSFDDFEKKRIKTLDVINKIDNALQDQLRLDAFSLNVEEPKVDPYGMVSDTLMMKAALRIVFPPSISAEVGLREINNFKRRLDTVFPEYEVIIVKKPTGYEYSDVVSGSFDDAVRTADEIAPEESISEITIEGAI